MPQLTVIETTGGLHKFTFKAGNETFRFRVSRYLTQTDDEEHLGIFLTEHYAIDRTFTRAGRTVKVRIDPYDDLMTAAEVWTVIRDNSLRVIDAFDAFESIVYTDSY